MNNKTIYIAILGLMFMVCPSRAAHLVQNSGQVEAYSYGYVYNTIESDPFDDPNTPWREYKWLDVLDPNLIDITGTATISTASWNNHAAYSSILDAQGVTINMVMDAYAESLSSDSSIHTVADLRTEDYVNVHYGLFYKVASDGESAGTPVKIRLSWNAQAQVTGSGTTCFTYPYSSDGILVAVNGNPSDSVPAAGSIIYRMPSFYFYPSDPARTDTVEFMAAVGDRVSVYLGGFISIYENNEVFSADSQAEMTVNLQVVEDRSNIADINHDKRVDLADLMKLALNWLWEAPPPSNQICDYALLVQPGKVYEETTVDTTNGELWYQLRPTENTRHIVSLCGSDFDTRLTLYYRYNGSAEPCPGHYWAENDDFCDLQSQLEFPSWYNEMYYFKVDSPSGQRGNVRLEVTRYTPPVNDEFDSATDADPNTLYTGSTLGSVNDAYVWYRFTPAGSDFYTLSLCGSSFDTMLGLYDETQQQLDLNDNACDQQSEMPVYLTAGVPYYIAVGSDYSERGDYQFRITQGAAVPANDECVNATTISRWDWIENSTAVATGSDVSSCGTDDVQDVWYRFTADSDMTYNFQLYVRNSNFEETITLYDTTACPGTEILCNQTAFGVVQFQQTMTTGQEILIRIAGYAGRSGYYTLYIW